MKRKKAILERREFILKTVASCGAIGLKSLFLGLPPSFLSNGLMANVNTGEKYLILSTDFSGPPVNCNTPGTYHSNLVHPGASGYSFDTAPTLQLGQTGYKAASCWSDLSSELKSRFHFFHYKSLSSGHNEAPSVMKAHGAIRESGGGAALEMLPSAIAQHTAGALGTTQQKPIDLSGSVSLSYKGNFLGPQSPANLKQILSSDSGKAFADFRDSQLDILYGDLKQNGTKAQRDYLDQHVNSRDQARLAAEKFTTLLDGISGSTTHDQIIAASAFVAAKMTPVIVIKIPFGGDNHTDVNLAQEVSEHNAGVASINFLWQKLSELGVQDQAIFAMHNVFGRGFSINSSGGRDHNGHHSTMLMFGKDVKPGVSGGVEVISTRERGGAMGINSENGSTNQPDIASHETLGSSVKTLMKACGMSDSDINQRVVSGKIVKSAIDS